MDAYVLPRESNNELRQLLQLEYTREEVQDFFTEVSSIIGSTVVETALTENVVYALNKIIFDNVLRQVNRSDMGSLVHPLVSGVGYVEFDIGHRHIQELLGNYYTYAEEVAGIPLVQRAVSNYLIKIQQRNTLEFGAALLKMLEYCFKYFTHLKDKTLVGSFMDNTVPVVYVA